MSNNLEVLADNREDIFLAEVAAWLHDMGKCDERFVERQAGVQNSYDYETDHLDLIDDTWKISLLEEEILLKELIEEGKSRNIGNEDKKWLVRVLGFCHSAAHTVKELVFYFRSQPADNTRRGNSFGYEPECMEGLKVRLDGAGKPGKGLPFGQLSDRSLMKQKIEEAFTYACADTQHPINDVSLWDWSNMVAALYKAAIAEGILVGKKEPSEIQWRLLSVRFDGVDFLTKTTRISDLLARRQLIDDGLNRVSTLLEVTYPLGTEVYRDENGSVFIVPDIEHLDQWENEQEQKLSTLIEHEFYKGTVKSDENGHLCLDGEILPTLTIDESSWVWKNLIDQEHNPLIPHNEPLPIAAHITENPVSHANLTTVVSWWRGHREDICTVCQLRPQGWGADDREKHYGYKDKGESCSSKLPCQTCKALNRKACAVCEQRRENNSKEWSDKLYTTIWIDEVADINGKVALIVGKFGLDTWFNGSSLFYPQKRQSDEQPIQGALKVKNLSNKLDDGKRVSIDKKDYQWQEKPALLVTASLRGLSQFKLPSPFRSNKLYIADIKTLVTIKDINLSVDGQYQLFLENHPVELVAGTPHSVFGQEFRVSDDGLYLETMSNMAKGVIKEKILHYQSLKIEKHFILPILEPSPSQMIEAQAPTRLFRVWETTRSFWENVVSDFNKPDSVGEVPCRLQIIATYYPNKVNQTLGISHAYELKLGEINLSIACVSQNKFFTIDNLRRIALLLGASEEEYKDDKKAAKYLQGQLEGKTFDIEEPTGYGGFNKPLGSLQITTVDIIEKPSYTPAISLLTEPRTFMALVPADKALQVANAIKEKYEREMGKVRNRLPLTLGVAFAGARTPLPAILDAGRRMLKQPTEATSWRVKRVDLSLYPEQVLLTLEPGEDEEPSLTLTIPTIMGDEVTEDVWYPYWCLEEEATNASERKRKFKGIDGKYWTHASDLQVGDVVSFMSSRFDFEYLDTAARRFEVSYEHGKRRGTRQSGGSYHPARPYYLEQLDEFEKLWSILSQGLETTQIHNIIGTIEDKRMEWGADQNNEIFKQAIRDALYNAHWKPRPEARQFDQLCEAALSGQLADTIELKMRILNERLKDNRQTAIDKMGEDL